MNGKSDAFELERLEAALNDSANRVSTIWVSFLVLLLYFAIALGAVTHRQLLIGDALRLPVLNVDLPLVGFFFVSPCLLVAFHLYVLLQVMLLARTAAAFSEVVDRKFRAPPANSILRQRLANTLFAQIFAGSPRERYGAIGGLLKGIAAFTLAVLPVLVLYGFQLVFLPYHDARITWIHRALIVLDVFIILTLWPLIRNGGRNCGWTLSRVEISVFVSVVVVSSVVAMMLHFPGEKFVRIFFVEGAKFDEAEICSASILARYDRLSLRNVDIV